MACNNKFFLFKPKILIRIISFKIFVNVYFYLIDEFSLESKYKMNPQPWKKTHTIQGSKKVYNQIFNFNFISISSFFFLAHKSRLDRKFISWYCAGIKKSLLYPWLELVVFYSFFVELFVLALAAKHINYFIVMAFLTQINFVGLMWLCKQRFKTFKK